MWEGTAFGGRGTSGESLVVAKSGQGPQQGQPQRRCNPAEAKASGAVTGDTCERASCRLGNEMQ